MFRMLKLKPPHGWHAVFWELAIVTLGVLIALGGERLVSYYLERQEADFTEAALKSELLYSAWSSIERLTIEDCLRKRIAYLDSKLRRSNRWTADTIPYRPYNYVRPTLATVYRPARRPWNSDVWQMAISSGMVRHIPRERVSAYSRLYQAVRRLRETNDAEYNALSRLGPLRTDQDLDPHSATEASVALTELDLRNSSMVGSATQFLTHLKSMRLGYTAKEIDTSFIVAEQRQLRGACVKDVRVSF